LSLGPGPRGCSGAPPLHPLTDARVNPAEMGHAKPARSRLRVEFLDDKSSSLTGC
jgi:hypothetical protein